jgi:hypothetical protein
VAYDDIEKVCQAIDGLPRRITVTEDSWERGAFGDV